MGKQDGGVEGYALIFSLRTPKMQLADKKPQKGGCWNSPKRNPASKDKGEAAMRWQEGTITLKSNPIPASWATHQLENDNTKEVLTLLQRFQAPHHTTQPWDLAKGLGIPREADFEVQQGLMSELPQDQEKHF